ncbi:hypothetical protein BH23VER1_BH23VER1_10070 [soil metagenome]
MRLTPFLPLVLSAITAAHAQQQLLTPTGVVLEAGTEFFSAFNLVDNSGLDGFADASNYFGVTHAAASASVSWTTDAPGGGTADYFALDPFVAPPPVLTFSLDGHYSISDLVFWGYHFGAPNGNEAKSFTLEFSTDGGLTYPISATVSNTDGLTQGIAKTLPVGGNFSANSIRMTVTDNWFEDAPGGDRVGIGEVKFLGQVATDPLLSIASSFALGLDGTVQTLVLPFANGGESQGLAISSVTVGGADAANFEVTSFSADVDPGEAGEIVLEFDPMGMVGQFEAHLTIASNDATRPMVEVSISGTVRDPMIVIGPVPFPILGSDEAGTAIDIPVSNLGASQDLTLASLTFSGPDADHFSWAGTGSVDDPSPVVPSGSGSLTITFDAAGRDGLFRAEVAVGSNDPGEPFVTLPLSVYRQVADPLAAWWPLDTDATDASGNGFDGFVEGFVAFGQPGAIGATGTAADFDGFSRIGVPFAEALNPAGSFTVTLWAFADSTAGFQSAITSRDDVDAGVETHGYIIYNNSDGNWDFWTGDGAPGWDTLPGSVVNSGNWEHIAIVYDFLTNTKILYVNCQEVARDDGASAPQYSPNGTTEMHDLHIGAGGDFGSEFFFDGRIDDVAVFRDALTPGQILTICEQGVIGFLGGGTAAFEIVSLVREDATTVTLEFSSEAGVTYAVDRSTDLRDWSFELDDSVIGEGGTTSFTDTIVPAGAPEIFYRVRRR